MTTDEQAAREYARKVNPGRALDRDHAWARIDHMAGAQHGRKAALAELTEDELEKAAIAVCWAGFAPSTESFRRRDTPQKYWERVTEPNRDYYRRLARGVYEVLQRLRGG